jgi:WD repeat-containing protein 42A
VLGSGRVETRRLGKHKGRAHKLSIEPASPHRFLSCGEDGVVNQFDLREDKGTRLFVCHSFHLDSSKPSHGSVVRLNSIVINPQNTNYFSVGGSDEFARVYDIRRVNVNASSSEDQPVDSFTPKHLLGTSKDPHQYFGQVHITCVAYSHQEELLVSYNDELIYSFDKDMGLGPNPKERQHTGDMKGDDIDSQQDCPGPQVFEGHRNAQTVKGVNYFGPNTEYVVSGSDCGRIFIWKKKGGKLLALLKGDSQVVNCLEPHPYATILATSGIDRTIKVWAPTAPELLPLPCDVNMVASNLFQLRCAFSCWILYCLFCIWPFTPFAFNRGQFLAAGHNCEDRCN